MPNIFLGSQWARSSNSVSDILHQRFMIFHPTPGVSGKPVERGFQLMSHQFEHTWGSPMASEIWVDYSQAAFSFWGIMLQKPNIEKFDQLMSIIFHLSSIIIHQLRVPIFHQETLARAAAGQTPGHHFRARGNNVPLMAHGAADGCLGSTSP